MVDGASLKELNCSMIQAQQTAQRQEEIDALNQDEFDPEAQARIAERIQQENIQANMEAAFEHSPEAFGQVTMLYVRLEASFCYGSSADDLFPQLGSSSSK